MKKKYLLEAIIHNYGFLIKIFRIMRISAFLLFIGILQVFATDSYSQATRLTLSMSDVTVQQVLGEIESQSEFYILFNHQLVDVARKVNIEVSNKRINNILTALFKSTDIEYLVMGRQIILSPKDILYEGVAGIQRIQADNEVQGTIIDRDGNPIPGVNIIIKGTTHGTISDANGNYTINVDDPSATLVFTFIAMLSQEVMVGTQTIINVTMESDVLGLEEVVVIGYGTQKKINLTGAVSYVDSKVLESRPIANIGQGLQGTVSNLNVSQSSGALGAGSSFNIRGTTSISGGSPLILVNGIPMDINLINPSDIDNVTVLKDAASSAIYGARAAYGVILVTTKSGKKNDKPKVSLSMNTSVNKPTVTFKTMDAMERMTYMNEANMKRNGTPYYQFTPLYEEKITAHYNDPSQPSAFIDPTNDNKWLMSGNTDWGDVLLRNSFPQRQYAASVSGGSDKFDYYTSLSYFYQEGITKNFDEKFKRYNFMTNLNFDITEWATIGTRVSINTSNKMYPTNDRRNFFREDYTPFQYHQWANWPVYFPDGNYASAGSVPNMVQLHKEGGYRSRDINDMWITGLAKFTPVRNMTFNIDYSFNVNDTYEEEHRKRLPMYYVDGSISGYYPYTNPSTVIKGSYDNRYYVFNAYADYENTFGKHYLKAMVGFNQENRSNNYFSAQREKLIVETMPYMSLAYGERYVDDSASEYAIRGIFSRLNYSFDDRYLFEFNGRYDGTSKFSKNDRFAFFPSISMGWRIDNEAFFAGLENSINMLKLRVSYGSLGNQNVPGYYPYIATFGAGSADYLIGGEKPMTVYAPGLISPTLTWETVTQQDIGIDIAVLDNKLSATFDIYKRETKNMLTKSETLPAVLAEQEPKANAADLKTKGFDLTIHWKERINEISYEITFLLSDYTAEITKYSNPYGILSDYYVGQQMGEIWGMETGGFFETDEAAAALDQSQISGRTRLAGDIYFNDLDGDGIITRGNRTLDDHGDMRIIGNSTPRYSFGLRSYVAWKGFDLDVFLQGVGKRDRVISSTYWLGGYTSEWTAHNKVLTDWWSPENPDAYYPRPLISGGSDVTTPQTHFLQNAAYIRLKQLTLGYTFQMKLIQKLKIDRIRVYFSGNNLLEATKMIDITDPEQTGARYYPLYRSISFGANIDF